MNGTTTLPIPGFSDPVSSWLHLLGAGACLILGVPLIWRGRGWGAKFSLLVFVFSCVFLLAMSGVFHLLQRDTLGSEVLQRLDHAGIFLLIAGTFTPIHVILFRGWRRWVPLACVWIAAITGITLKTIFFRDIPEGLGLSFYLGLGWVGGWSAWLLYQEYGLSVIEWPLTGALAYTCGALLDYLRWPVVIPGVVGPHELFHAFVLAGIAAFWTFIHEAATGQIQKPNPPARAEGLEKRTADYTHR